MQLERGILASEQRGTQSETLHVPPESVRMLALTARMYAMVRNVAVPARNSVVKVVFLSASLNRFPTRVLATYEFNLVERERSSWGSGGVAAINKSVGFGKEGTSSSRIKRGFRPMGFQDTKLIRVRTP